MSGAQSLEVMLILLVFLAEQVISMSGFFPPFLPVIIVQYLSTLCFPIFYLFLFFFHFFCRISQVKVLQKLEVQFPLVMNDDEDLTQLSGSKSTTRGRKRS